MLKKILIILLFLIFVFSISPLFSQEGKGDKGGWEKRMADQEQSLKKRRRQLKIRKQLMEVEEQELRLDLREKIHHKKHEKMMKDLKEGRLPKKSGAGKKHKSPFMGHGGHRFFGFRLFILCMLIIRILLLIVVTKDVKERTNISSIWIFIVLLGGIPAAIAYTLFCISNKKTNEKK